MIISYCHFVWILITAYRLKLIISDDTPNFCHRIQSINRVNTGRHGVYLFCSRLRKTRYTDEPKNRKPDTQWREKRKIKNLYRRFVGKLYVELNKKRDIFSSMENHVFGLYTI